MTIAKQRRAEVDRARQVFRKLQRLPCAKCGQLDHWKDDNECPAKVKVVIGRRPRSQRLRNRINSLPSPFCHTGGERCATTSGVIDTASARTQAETRWFEKFEIELKRHATPVEVVPDSETFRFGPGAVKKSSRAVIFSVAVGQNVFLLRASLLDDEVPLLIRNGGVQQLGSVIDFGEEDNRISKLLGTPRFSLKLWLVT